MSCKMPDLGLEVLLKGENMLRLLGGFAMGAETSRIATNVRELKRILEN